MISITKNKRQEIIDWLEMKEQDVLDKFSKLPNAQKIGNGDRQFVYVPGTREDKVLLVSHADTVHQDERTGSVGYKNGKFHSRIKGLGIGADDRAGCFILWELRNSGHSLLIPNGEESGCVGSRFLSTQKNWMDVVNSHSFAIEFDRRHSSDLVFYDVGSNSFTKWCEENFRGYKKDSGSFTDIGVLCNPICGVNISVGYYNEHSDREMLNEVELYRTLNTAFEVLSNNKNKIPRFEQDPKPKYVAPVHNSSYRRVINSSSLYNSYTRYRNNNEFDSYDDYFTETRGIPRTNISESKKNESASDLEELSIIKQDRNQTKYDDKFDTIIVCPLCDCVMEEVEHSYNNQKCVGCKEKFSIIS